MNVILLKDMPVIKKKMGDLLKVARGYARNYLVPQGLAVIATKEAQEKFSEQQQRLIEEARLELEEAKRRSEEINDIEITLTAKAGASGKLFGSFTAKDLAEAINQAGFKVSKKEIVLKNGPIRSIGEYNIKLNLHSEVSSSIRFCIVAEDKE